MSRRAKRPLNQIGVKKANADFYAKYPNMRGKSLNASMRREWMDSYIKHGSEIETQKNTLPKKKPNTIVQQCPPSPKPITLNKCDEIKKHVNEGDIVLRGEQGDSESEFFAKVSNCDFSHAGIVARDSKGDLVVDAYLGRGVDNKNAVAHSVDDFFCGHKATQGLVSRPKDCVASKKAAEWAMKQTEDPDYTFDLFDPWNKDKKSLYCSDFVHQSYQNAGLDLVPNKMDFLSPANKANTLKEARNFDKKGYLLSDAKLKKHLLQKTGGSSEYITPYQVADNLNTKTVVNFAK